jgi:hypothetical protein
LPEGEESEFGGVALNVPSETGWHLETMTTSEPDPAADPSITAGDRGTAADAATSTKRQSRWSKLDRTNQVAALVLGGVAAVFVAGLIFGAGVLVGAEFGGEEGHHHGWETSDYGADGQDSGEHDGGGFEDNGDRGGDGRPEGNRDQGESDQQPSRHPAQPAPTATSRP